MPDKIKQAFNDVKDDIEELKKRMTRLESHERTDDQAMNDHQRILVTGAAGFIGSHTAETLADDGHDVLGVDNVNDYYTEEQKERNIDAIRDAGVRFERRDIRDETTYERIVEFDPDVIIHIAAMAGVRWSIDNPEEYIDVNVTGTQRVLSAAEATDAFTVMASSSSVYGARDDAPFSEDDAVDHQVSPYAATKRCAELLAQVHEHLNDLPVTCLRFFTVYGPRGRPDMAPYKFIRMVDNDEELTRYGDGTSARDYTYVDDIVQGITKAMQNPNGYELYNLGNNDVVELNDFIATVEDVVGKDANIVQLPEQPGDVPLTCADISKAQDELGYNPQTSLEEGLTEMYKWYKREANE